MLFEPPAYYLAANEIDPATSRITAQGEQITLQIRDAAQVGEALEALQREYGVGSVFWEFIEARTAPSIWVQRVSPERYPEPQPAYYRVTLRNGALEAFTEARNDWLRRSEGCQAPQPAPAVEEPIADKRGATR